jgi:acyl-CoA reductase-like NAD-dependent aldehyde dehydrogenase
MISHKIAPAIATNNCMVAKPTEQTPLTALILADIIYEAGLPPEMLSVVTGLPQDMGDEMLTNKHIDLISFTGSVPVGKYIAETAGYRRTVLELGGNSPLIVMDDADLDKAAELAVAGGTKNSGQRCTAVKRVLCIDSAGDEFAALVAEKAAKLKYGDPMDPDTDVGTVINEASAILFQNRVNDAIEKGATLLYGNDRQGAVYSPTVLDHVPYDCELVREETFGPVFRRLYQPHGRYHPLHQRARNRHGQHLGSAGLPHRNVALRRHQGFGPRLQGRRYRSDDLTPTSRPSPCPGYKKGTVPILNRKP